VIDEVSDAIGELHRNETPAQPYQAQSQHSCVELSRALAGTARLQIRTCHFRGIRLLGHTVLGMKLSDAEARRLMQDVPE